MIRSVQEVGAMCSLVTELSGNSGGGFLRLSVERACPGFAACCLKDSSKPVCVSNRCFSLEQFPSIWQAEYLLVMSNFRVMQLHAVIFIELPPQYLDFGVL